MIAPKTARPTAAEEREAYRLATERDDGHCAFRAWDCAGGVQRDHRKNRSQGGLTVASDLQLLCAVHHLAKTDNPEWANRNGWGVPAWADPAEYPARRYMQTPYGTLRLAWVLLDDDGSWTEISADEARERGRGLIP